MPLQLIFIDPELKELCERQAIAEEALGADCARRLRARLADLQAATNVGDVKAGRPAGADGAARVSFLLGPKASLVLAPADSPIPLNDEGAVQWIKVTKVCVTAVGEKNE